METSEIWWDFKGFGNAKALAMEIWCACGEGCSVGGGSIGDLLGLWGAFWSSEALQI